MKLIALSLALLCGCASLQEGEGWAIGASVADVASTAYGMNRGAEEMNPILTLGGDEAAQVLVTSAVVSTSIHLLLRKLWKKYPRELQARHWLTWAGLRGGAAAWNTYQIQEIP